MVDIQKDEAQQLAKAFKNMKTMGEFDIQPFDAKLIEKKSEYKKLNITESQQKLVLSFINDILDNVIPIKKTELYTVKFPKGMPHSLMKFQDGGFGSAVVNGNKIISHASFHKIADLNSAVGTISIMMVAVAQYFLDQVMDKLDDIQTVSESILEFLHDDKKAELKSEIKFINNSFQNYQFIVQNEVQRVATIGNIQSAVKTAFKDCEFYCGEMKKYAFKEGNSPIENDVKMSFYFEELLKWSMELYAVANVLEIYYSKNFNSNYLKVFEKDIIDNISSYEKNIRESFIHLKKRVNSTYDQWYWQYKNRGEDLEKIIRIIDEHDKKSDLQETVKTFLYLPVDKKEYYISTSGDVYIKTS